MHNPSQGTVRVLRRPEFPTSGKLPYIERHHVTLTSEPPVLAILSHQVEQLWVHVVGGLAKPCTDAGPDCVFSHDSSRPQWHGYLMVWDADARETRYVILSTSVCDYEPRLLERGRDLRGRGLKLWRERDAINGPLFAQLVGLFKSPSELPPCPPMDRHLARLMGGKARRAEFYYELEEVQAAAAKPVATDPDEKARALAKVREIQAAGGFARLGMGRN